MLSQVITKSYSSSKTLKMKTYSYKQLTWTNCCLPYLHAFLHNLNHKKLHSAAKNKDKSPRGRMGWLRPSS